MRTKLIIRLLVIIYFIKAMETLVTLPHISEPSTSASAPKQHDTEVQPPQPPLDVPLGNEPWYSTILQIGIPFMLAGVGTITAGILLGNVQEWTVFKQMNELFVLVPALCGLKGNLDMCVASRLSTLSNLGNLQDKRSIWQILIGNLALVQVQAIVCSLLLAILTVVIGSTMEKKLMLHNFTTLAAAALLTASTSCLILDSLLMVVILFSQRYKFNPDYMATPIVASIGDVVSISLLSFTAAFLYDMKKNWDWLTFIVMFCYIALLLPMWVIIVLHNIYTRKLLRYGWIPVLGALCLSEFGGFVLSSSVEQFRGFAVFSPIINGIGGNLVSVQASNMSSLLYQRATIGTVPPDTRICEAPHRILFYGSIYANVSRALILVSIPGNIILVYAADYLYKSFISVKFPFLLAYSITALVQLLILLLAAHILVHSLWKWKMDPDSAAIPYLTAFGDSMGTGLLSVTFHILRATNMEYEAKSLPWLRVNYDEMEIKFT